MPMLQYNNHSNCNNYSNVRNKLNNSIQNLSRIQITHELNENEWKSRMCYCPAPLPMVLNEILLKLRVSVCIFNLLVGLKKSSNALGSLADLTRLATLS